MKNNETKYVVIVFGAFRDPMEGKYLVSTLEWVNEICQEAIERELRFILLKRYNGELGNEIISNYHEWTIEPKHEEIYNYAIVP